MYLKDNGKDKASKVKNWTTKLDKYYLTASDKKMRTDLTRAGFKVKKKNT